MEKSLKLTELSCFLVNQPAANLTQMTRKHCRELPMLIAIVDTRARAGNQGLIDARAGMKRTENMSSRLGY